MERNTLRLEILGQVTPRTLAEVLSHLQGLLDALADEIAPGMPLEWHITTET